MNTYSPKTSTTTSTTKDIQAPQTTHNASPPIAQPEKPRVETEPGKAFSNIQNYLHQGVNEAIQTSEALTKHVEKQAKFLKVLALVFATFSAYLQVRQVYMGNAGSQQASKFSAWEMVQNVQGKDVATSAGLAIALKTLANNCEPLSGIDLTGKYLPSIELAPPRPSTTEHILSLVGVYLFAVESQSECSGQNSAKNELASLDLRGITFKGAMLQEASFTNTNLTGGSFQEANLANAQFKGERTNLEETNLQRADFSGVDLSRVNLTGANLSGTTLSGADFTKADLSKAIILGTDLRETQGLTQQQFEGEAPPLLCNSVLPAGVTVENGLHRDCDAIAAILHEQSPKEFPTPEKAKTYVEDQRQQTFEPVGQSND